MKIKKMCGIVAAIAICLCAGFSSAEDIFPTDSETASPFVCTGNRADLVEWVQEFARFTRCYDYPSNLSAGQWDRDDPIWQWRGGKGDGCEVHWKLSKLLDEQNDSGGSKKQGKNGNRGTAASLADGKDYDAVNSLIEFVDVIQLNAVLRSDDHEVELADGTKVIHTESNHRHFADDFVAEAEDIIECANNGLSDY